MSVLDTFYLLFESDSSKLKTGLDEARKKGQDTAEGMRAVDLAASKMGHTIKESLAELGGALAGALALHAMSEQILQATEYTDHLNESAERLGVNIELLGQWGDLVKKNGGSLDGFVGSIQMFNEQLSMLATTGTSRVGPFLQKLGINLADAKNKGKTAMDFLPQIADAFAKMGRQQSTAFGQKMGFDAGTIMTLQAGRREVESLLEKERELGVVTKEQGEMADKFGDQLDDTKHAFRSMWMEVATAVLPTLTSLLVGFEHVATFMRKHSDFIIGLMIALGAAIAFYVVPPLLSAGAAAIVAFAPFLLLGAIIGGLAVAFALLYDDVKNFIDGNDSLIGQVLQKFPVIGEVIGDIVDVVKALGDAFMWTFNTLADLLHISFTLWEKAMSKVLEFTGVFEAVGALTDATVETFKAMGDVVGGVWDFIIAKVKAFIQFAAQAVGLVRGVAGAITGALGSAKDALGIGNASSVPQARAGVAGGLANGRAQLAATNSPIASTTSNAITNTRRGGDRNVSVGDVHVHTQATDAAGISKSVGGALGSQMRQANSQFDDGVAA